MADLKGTPTGRGRTYDNAKQYYMLSLGLKSHAGLILGGGTSTDPVSTSVASKNFASFYTQSTATSGDARGIYFRHYLAGAGVSGEAARFYTTASAIGVNGHGAHISLDFGSSAGGLTGEGYAVKATLHIPNRALTSGNLSPLEAEIYCDGSSGTVTNVTELHLARFAVTGNATAIARVEDKAALFYLDGFTSATGNIWYDSTLRINCNGTTKYLVLSDAEDSLTFSGTLAVTGNLDMSAGASDIITIANTAAALEFYDSTTKYAVFDTRNTITGVSMMTLTGIPATIVAASGVTRRILNVAAGTTTLTGSTGVTDMSGIGVYIAAPTLTDSSAVTVAKASTMCIAGPPTAAGSVTLTTGLALEVLGQTNFGVNDTGVDVMMYGATAANYLHWDQSEDDLLLVGTATQLAVAGTTTSSSPTTGSLRTAGGLGVAGTAFIGDLLTLTGATGIAFTGTLTKGINFAGATPAFTDDDDAFIAIGTWNDAFTVTGQIAHFVPIQVNLLSSSTTAHDIAAARFRVNTGAANTATSVNVLELRSALSHNVAAHANLQVSTTISDTVEVQSGEALVAYFAFDGASAMTNIGANPTIAIAEFKLNNTATTLTDMVILEAVNATTCVNMMRLKSNDATVTNMVQLYGGTNVTSFIDFKAGTGGTTLVKTGTASGTCVQLTVSIDGTAYYLNAYPTQN